MTRTAALLLAAADLHAVQIVTLDAAGDWNVTLLRSDECEMEAALAVRGYTVRGYTKNDGPLREELRGRPRLVGLAGPMWGGHTDDGVAIIRYEGQRANDVLSA